MSCCSREEFVKQKARNMRDWLKPWAKQEHMAMYDEDKIVVLVLTTLLPMFSSGRLDEATGVVMDNLVGVPDDQRDAVRTKVGRYLSCFCEAMMI
jgi:hypothetical protein